MPGDGSPSFFPVCLCTSLPSTNGLITIHFFLPNSLSHFFFSILPHSFFSHVDLVHVCFLESMRRRACFFLCCFLLSHSPLSPSDPSNNPTFLSSLFPIGFTNFRGSPFSCVVICFATLDSRFFFFRHNVSCLVVRKFFTTSFFVAALDFSLPFSLSDRSTDAVFPFGSSPRSPLQTASFSLLVFFFVPSLHQFPRFPMKVAPTSGFRGKILFFFSARFPFFFYLPKGAPLRINWFDEPLPPHHSESPLFTPCLPLNQIVHLLMKLLSILLPLFPEEP